MACSVFEYAIPTVALGRGEHFGDRRGNVVLEQVLFSDRFVNGGRQSPGVRAGVSEAHGLQNRRHRLIRIGLAVNSFTPIEDDVFFGVQVVERFGHIGANRRNYDFVSVFDQRAPHALGRLIRNFRVSLVPIAHHTMEDDGLEMGRFDF